jgi:hypothetical protein
MVDAIDTAVEVLLDAVVDTACVVGTNGVVDVVANDDVEATLEGADRNAREGTCIWSRQATLPTSFSYN